MFLVKADTVIQVKVPKSQKWFNTVGWRSYRTTEDKIYDKHEVYDIVRVDRASEQIPEWIRLNVIAYGKYVLFRDGKYALVNPQDITYLD